MVFGCRKDVDNESTVVLYKSQPPKNTTSLASEPRFPPKGVVGTL